MEGGLAPGSWPAGPVTRRGRGRKRAQVRANSWAIGSHSTVMCLPPVFLTLVSGSISLSPLNLALLFLSFLGAIKRQDPKAVTEVGMDLSLLFLPGCHGLSPPTWRQASVLREKDPTPAHVPPPPA